MTKSRRDAIKLILATLGYAINTSDATTKKTQITGSKKIVIIGGGFAGATLANTLHTLDKTLHITLIEPNKYYHSCPLGAEYLVGKRTKESLTFSYRNLSNLKSINVIHDTATHIDYEKKIILTKSSGSHSYDRCVVGVGVGYKFDAIEGYSPEVSKQLPHAWSGGEQHAILKKQLMSLRDGGNVLISAPSGDYKCPPGPYERASLIAEFLKRNKRRSKIIILDGKSDFPKQELFEKAWRELYGYGTSNSIIEWISSEKGGVVSAVNPRNKDILTSAGTIRADILNIIPPQKAGTFAHFNELTGPHGWCPIDTKTFESSIKPYVHVIGDAAYAEMLPKSAFTACVEARVCAVAIYCLFNNHPIPCPQFMNVCYSLCAENYGISVFLRYERNIKTNILDIKNLVKTPLNSTKEDYRKESQFGYGMFNTMTAEAFG